MSRDVYQRGRLVRWWRCEPNEVVAEVRSEKGEGESCPQSTPSKGMVVVQVQEGLKAQDFGLAAQRESRRTWSFRSPPPNPTVQI